MKVNPKVNGNDVNKLLQDKTIQGLKNTQAEEVEKSNKAHVHKEVVSQSAKDASAKVDLSPRAQAMKKIKELAHSAPDVDEAKVKKFQELIDKGLYKVDSKNVADKMVEDSLMSGLHEES